MMNFSKKLHTTKIHNEVSDDEASYNGSYGSLIETDEDYEYQPEPNPESSPEPHYTKKGARTIQRKPTRVPNMKIQNRNAILARENRRRKKEMMDSLEKTVNVLQNENKKLIKMVKSRDGHIYKLEKEIFYLKSVITNHTEIASVLRSLPKFPLKSTNPIEGKNETSTGSETSASASLEDNTLTKGSVEPMNDPFMPTIFDDFLSSDLIAAAEWDEILRNPFTASSDFSEIQKIDDIELLSPASSPENYSRYNQVEKTSLKNDGAGVCVHINSGRVSLEFCSTCHYNATNTQIESN